MKISKKNTDQTTSASCSQLALVADDNQLIRSSEALLLEHAGFEVVTASDGAEAISLFKEHQQHVGVVVTGLEMSRASGEDLCRVVNKEQPDVPVFLVSSDPSRVKPYSRANFTSIFKKPFSAIALYKAASKIAQT